MLLLLFIPLVTSDSIILQNDCKRTSEKCFITLEVIKGEPKKDCSIFSTVDRICTIGEELPTETPRGDEVQVSESDGKTVVSWTGQKIRGNGSETNSLVASSIWQRIKRQIKGQVINCTCTPVRRQKRSAEADVIEITEVGSDDSEEFYPDCPLGYLPSDLFIDPSGIPAFPVITTVDEEECADSCSGDYKCDSFGFDSTSDALNCALLGDGPFDIPFGPFVVYEKC